MFMWLSLIAILLSGALFGWGIPLDRLFDAFQPMVVAFSIVIAALLVRLNRGMPTLDWKGLEQHERVRLTASIVGVTREYVIIVFFNAVMLVALVSMMGIGKQAIQLWSPNIMEIVSGLVGALSGLCLSRMAYVVWRDFDIVRLQKTLIDAAGERDRIEAEKKAAAEKIAEIHRAGLRKGA